MSYRIHIFGGRTFRNLHICIKIPVLKKKLIQTLASKTFNTIFENSQFSRHVFYVVVILSDGGFSFKLSNLYFAFHTVYFDLTEILVVYVCAIQFALHI